MSLVLLDRPRSGVLLVTLNRPTKRNALNVALVAELAQTLKAAETDDAVRCVVVTGDDKAFSAGADIADQHTQGTSAVFSPLRLESWDVIQDFAKPTIAAVNGYALGGGCELMMLLDMAIAGEGAIFGQPEINLGIFPGDGATQRLPRRIGAVHALRYILTGERFNARKALELGLVCEVVPDGDTVSRALDLAETIAKKSPLAVRMARASVLEGLEVPLASGLLMERRNLALVFGSADQREGMSAFVEKRDAKFS